LIPLPGPQWSRATPAQTLPVGHLDRYGLQTDIVEQPRMLTAFRQINGRIFAKPPHLRERSPPGIIVIGLHDPLESRWLQA
jgi:hypothetical protein